MLNHIACQEEDGINSLGNFVNWIKPSLWWTETMKSMYFFLMKNQHFGLSGNLLISKFELTKLMKDYWFTRVCWFGCWKQSSRFTGYPSHDTATCETGFIHSTHFTHQTKIFLEIILKRFMNFVSTSKFLRHEIKVNMIWGRVSSVSCKLYSM